MQNRRIGLWAVVLCLFACLPALPAQMVFTEGGGGGGGGRMVGPHHIEFALQYNIQTDHSDGVNNGGGFLLGYRYSFNPVFSIGGRLGGHGYTIKNGGFEDSVSSVPLLVTAQVERNFDHVFTFYGNIGMGPSFNNITGDVTDLFDLELGTSFAVAIDFGGTLEMTPNFSIGMNFDWFISTAPVDSPSVVIDDHLNISHFGIGVIAVTTF